MAPPPPLSSPLARAPRLALPRASRRLYGVMMHTTGRTVVKRARDRRVDPLQVVLQSYARADNRAKRSFPAFATYVIGYDRVVQIADEAVRARHAGIDRREKRLYASGRWRRKVPTSILALWDERWPQAESPLDLFPNSPNEDYLGVEMIPLAKPLSDGSWYSATQYALARALLADITRRRNVRLRGKRLVGHEDVEPLTRWNRRGGWDPGALRPGIARFRWDRLMTCERIP